jgi:hypothetical protein
LAGIKPPTTSLVTQPALSESEETFIELVLEVGGVALDQDTFTFMIEKGTPVAPFLGLPRDFTLGEVLKSLEEKGLVYTEPKQETTHYNGGLRGKDPQPIKWEDTGFKRAEREYIRFTEELEKLWKERS